MHYESRLTCLRVDQRQRPEPREPVGALAPGGRARRRHHLCDTIYKEYVDEKSGGNSNRKAFQEMMRDAIKRRFNLVRVFDLDREKVFQHTATLEQAGILELLRAGPEHHRPDGQLVQVHHCMGRRLPQPVPLGECAATPGPQVPTVRAFFI